MADLSNSEKEYCDIYKSLYEKVIIDHCCRLYMRSLACYDPIVSDIRLDLLNQTAERATKSRNEFGDAIDARGRELFHRTAMSDLNKFEATRYEKEDAVIGQAIDFDHPACILHPADNRDKAENNYYQFVQMTTVLYRYLAYYNYTVYGTDLDWINRTPGCSYDDFIQFTIHYVRALQELF